MTKKIHCLLVLGLLLSGVATRSEAQETPSRTPGPAAVAADVPPIVLEGLAAYRKTGARSAIEVWLRNSPVAGTTNIDQLLAALAPVETAYGAMTGYDVLRVVHIGRKVRRVYFVVQYERGPLYGFIDCYETSKGWVVPGFLTNAQPSVILPPDLLAGK